MALLARPRAVLAGDASLTLLGDVPSPGPISPGELSKIPGSTLTASANGGEDVRYSGWYLHDLLGVRGSVVPESPKNACFSYVVIARGQADYRVALAFAEIDPRFAAQPIFVASHADGVRLDPDDGLRLIVKGDRKPGRWVKGLTTLEVKRF